MVPSCSAAQCYRNYLNLPVYDLKRKIDFTFFSPFIRGKRFFFFNLRTPPQNIRKKSKKSEKNPKNPKKIRKIQKIRKKIQKIRKIRKKSKKSEKSEKIRKIQKKSEKSKDFFEDLKSVHPIWEWRTPRFMFQTKFFKVATWTRSAGADWH